MNDEGIHLDYSTRGMVRVNWDELIFVDPRKQDILVVEKRGRINGGTARL